MTPAALLLIFAGLLGLCVGSFLNVVVYRLPRGLSVARPARSFCPGCRASIAWYDNIPVLSWLWLRARCRACRAPISVQYPLVEALTAVTFVLVCYLLFVAHAHRAAPQPDILRDGPLLLSWLVLAAAMLACSTMDIVSYSVDIRVTNFALLAGVLFHAVWPRGAALAVEAGDPWVAAGAAATVAAGALLALRIGVPSAEEEEGSPPEPPVATSTRSVELGGRLGVLAGAALVGWMVWNATRPAGALSDAQMQTPVLGALLLLFGGAVISGGLQRPVDAEIRTEIEEERPHARRVVLRELAWLTPAAAVGVVAYVAAAAGPQRWSALASWSPGGDVAPLAGVAMALAGAAAGALAGWLLRIGFTLVLGREAFGVGDIYILAAAGAAAGAEITLLGLLLAVAIALLGWILGLLLKSTVMIPFGPWLALGFLAALWLNKPAMAILGEYRDNLMQIRAERPDMLAVIGGVLVVGAGGALLLARMVRRWVERDAAP